MHKLLDRVKLALVERQKKTRHSWNFDGDSKWLYFTPLFELWEYLNLGGGSVCIYVILSGPLFVGVILLILRCDCKYLLVLYLGTLGVTQRRHGGKLRGQFLHLRL